MGDTERLKEKLEDVETEIERLEMESTNWENLEKLSILYNVCHHLKKKIYGDSSGSEIGFRNRNSGSSREMRELANGMSKQELTEVIVNYGRELNDNGNGRNYNRLMARMRDYDRRGGNSDG